MRGNQPPPAAGPVTAEDIRAVQEVATRSAALDFEHEHSAPELQVAVARAVNHGATVKDVASAAHMTALEVLDAADRFTYPGAGAAILPEASGPVQ